MNNTHGTNLNAIEETETTWKRLSRVDELTYSDRISTLFYMFLSYGYALSLDKPTDFIFKLETGT